MSSTFTAAKQQQNDPSDIADYESLRREVVEEQRTGYYGMAVLVRQGLAAWVEQRSKITTVSPPAQTRCVDRPCPLPDDTSGEVVNVLVAMTLSHMKEAQV